MDDRENKYSTDQDYRYSYYRPFSSKGNEEIRSCVKPALRVPNPYYPENSTKWWYYHTPLWPIIVIGIIVFLIWSEYGSQDCRKQNCNNRARMIYDQDSNIEVVDKIMYNVEKNSRVIGWRRAMIAAIIVAIVILLMFCPEMPHGLTFLIVALIAFILIYLSSVWFQAHWWTYNNNKINNSLKELREKIMNINGK